MASPVKGRYRSRHGQKYSIKRRAHLNNLDKSCIYPADAENNSAELLEISREIPLSSYFYLFRQIEQRQEAGLEIRSGARRGGALW
jgi:hypothetical protein